MEALQAAIKPEKIFQQKLDRSTTEDSERPHYGENHHNN